MIPSDYCRNKAAPPGSSLHYSLLFVDAPRQQAIIAVHAFRQEISDIIEKCTDIEPARAKLAWWRMQTGALFEQRPDHPVTKALAEALEQFPIPQEHFQEIIDGFEMDLDQGRYDDYKSLAHYCHRVSSMTSMISAEILGSKEKPAAKFAHEIGLVLQLADIVRNVGLDARHGRIYLPLDELQTFGVGEDDIFKAKHSDNVKALIAFQIERVKSLHDNARSLLAAEDKKSQRALLSMASIQRALMNEIARDDYQVLDRGVSLTPLRRLWLAARTWLGA